ncbi:MAG: DNA-binding response regulator [Bacteroidetes bacterium]|nr:MAG: DNA-binding response regulator [Bacteroidota bacterium]
MRRCLVVEDSRLARKELLQLLEEINVFDVIEEAADGEEAMALLAKFQPDVIFLDIHLPGMTGFDLLENLDQIPKVIFTTAYDEYAIKSFDYNAIDYVLKPIKKQRLEKAIAKLNIHESAVKTERTDHSLQQVFVRDGEKCWFVKMNDIRIFESVGNYSRIYFDDNKPMIQRSLNYLEGVLDPGIFFRINRKQIINLNFIEKLDTWFSGKLKITLKTGEELEVSRRKSNQIKQMFSL